MNKRIAIAIAIVGITSSATVALAGKNAGTGINGSPHDLNQGIYTFDSVFRTCAFCHTPHNALTGANTVLTPLWNHADVNYNVTNPQAFLPYVWVAPANTRLLAAITDPLIGPSRLCMSCHDGTTAADAHGAAMGYAGSKTIAASPTGSYTDALGNTAYRYFVAPDGLRSTHPIGFDYDAAATTRGPREIMPSSHGFIAGAAPYGTAAANWDTNIGSRSTTETGGTTGANGKKIQDVLYSDGNGHNMMTCASCHDVHNTLNVSDAANSYNYFLYAEEAGSAICLSCHIK